MILKKLLVVLFLFFLLYFFTVIKTNEMHSLYNGNTTNVSIKSGGNSPDYEGSDTEETKNEQIKQCLDEFHDCMDNVTKL